MKNILLVLTALFLFVVPAQADVYKHQGRIYHGKSFKHFQNVKTIKYISRGHRYGQLSRHRVHATSNRYKQRHVAHHSIRNSHRVRFANGGRPAKWCGWFMRTLFGGGPEYNVAANWAHRGRPTSPHPGAIVVWPHHVGVIVGNCSGGRCVVKSGNWGNRVATVSMNVRNAIAFRTP